MKHVAEVSEIIDSTLNVRRKNILAETFATRGIYTGLRFFYI